MFSELALVCIVLATWPTLYFPNNVILFLCLFFANWPHESHWASERTPGRQFRRSEWGDHCLAVWYLLRVLTETMHVFLCNLSPFMWEEGPCWLANGSPLQPLKSSMRALPGQTVIDVSFSSVKTVPIPFLCLSEFRENSFLRDIFVGHTKINEHG
jgi:hypothetical protein